MVELVEYKLTVWHNEVRKYLFNLFSKHIIPRNMMSQKDIANKLLNNSSMLIWGRSLTPVIYTVNKKDNLETDEFLGDSTSAVALKKILIKKHFDEAEGSAIIQSINSSEHQWKATNFLELDKHIRLRYPTQYINNKIKTDIFESFMGACDKVSNMVQDGSGQVLNSLVMNYVYNNVFEPIILNDIGAIGGSGKTQVTQLFSRFGVGKPVLTTKRLNNGTYVSTLSLTDKQMNFLIQAGVNIQNNIIAKNVPGVTAEASSGKSYMVARRFLNDNLGLNPDWAKKMKSIQDMSTIPIDIWNVVSIKIQQDGYVSFYFEQPKKLFDFVQITLLLIGIKSNGEDENIQDLTYYFTPNDKAMLADKSLLADKTGNFKSELEKRLRPELIIKYINEGKYPEEV